MRATAMPDRRLAKNIYQKHSNKATPFMMEVLEAERDTQIRKIKETAHT